MGARFAKWRAVIALGDGIPSRGCIEANAQALGPLCCVVPGRWDWSLSSSRKCSWPAIIHSSDPRGDGGSPTKGFRRASHPTGDA